MINWIISFFTDSSGPLVLVAVLYICQMVAYLRQGETGMAIVFGAYALANFGFVYDFIRRFN